MPRPRGIPSRRFHSSGQSVVTLDGKSFYLGPHDSPEAQARYDTLIAKYLANGRRLWDDARVHQIDLPITVANVIAEYRREIAARPKQLNRWLHLCTLLEDEYGDVPAAEFGPRKLSAIRDLFVASGNTRTPVNEYTHRIVRVFEHAVSRELIDSSTLVRLQTLKPLRAGQTTAPEPKQRTPAPLEDVAAATKHLSPQARAIITIMVSWPCDPASCSTCGRAI